MTRTPPLVAGLAVAAPLLLGGCLGVETTQDKSARKAKEAGTRLATQKGLSIGRINPDVKIEQAAVIQDANGVAAVVRLKNNGAAQVTVPVAISVQDAKGTKLFANDAPGLEPALVSMPALQRGQDAYWVNNQIVVAGKATKVDARVGVATGRPPQDLPKITISKLAVGHDPDGSYATGIVRNESAIAQRRLTIFCVARNGARVEAAGRAVVDKLAPAAQASKPTKFTVYFIGRPTRADLTCTAPPTVLPGGAR